MSEQEQLAQLKRMRWIATSLLVLMAILFVGAKLLQSTYGYFSFVSAFAEAAMVGALADWFAVTALFRRPLGLPIPHTAIIPENKDRVGESIAYFLAHNFITREVLSEELAQIDFSGVAANWLMQPANSRAVATQIVSVVPALLHMIEDDDASRFLQRVIRTSMKDVKVAPLLAEVLSVLAAGQHHQILFDHAIESATRVLEQNKPYIRQKVHEQSPRWMPKSLDDKFFEHLIEGAQSILNEMQREGSEWREQFQVKTDELIDKLRSSPEYEEKIAGVVRRGLRHPLLHDYTANVWRITKGRLLADTTSADSKAVAKLDEAIRIFSKVLMQEETVRDKLNYWMRSFATETIVARRNIIAALVQRVIQKWDAETISRKFELHVGKDLQYIRINGTLVGGLVGLVLHTLSLALL